MRNTHAVWLVADASALLGGGADEPMDVVDDTTGAGRVLPTPRTPTRAGREEHDVSHVPHRPWCRCWVMVGETTPDTDWRP